MSGSDFMLVRELCRRCYDLNRTRKWSECPAKDRNWAKGRVACVMTWNDCRGHKYLKIKDLPPKNCPFLLEQTISQH